jgi:hypothetical protein
VLAYLARYTHRVAIANSRLISLSNGKVRFTWKDYRQSSKSKLMTLDADEYSSRPHSSKVHPPQSGGGSAIFPSVTRRSATCWWPPASGRMDEIETTFALTGLPEALSPAVGVMCAESDKSLLPARIR